MRAYLAISALSALLILAGCTPYPYANSPFDVAVTSASSSPATPQDGQALTLTFVIANDDTDGSTLTNIPWTLVRDGVSDFQSGTIASLAAGAAITQSVTFVESAGTHTYDIEVDPGNTIGEANLGNNQQFLIITVTGGPGTLDLSFDGTPTISPVDPSTSDLITISFAVANTSSAGTTASGVQYSVTRDGQPGFQFGSLPDIAANASQAASVEFTETTPGSHTYTIIIDPQNAIAETDETNNTFGLSAVVAASAFARR